MSLVAPVREDGPDPLRVPDWVAWSVLASLLLHVMVLGAAVWWPRRPTALPPPEESLPVDLVTPEQYEAATGARTAPQIAPAASENPPAASASPPTAPAAPAPAGLLPAAPGMIRPTTMLSALALADPKSAEGRAVLSHLNPSEQSVQLCDLEAMEQVHAWKAEFNPERIVAYATADMAIAGDTIKAPGAAFLSGGRWYELRFDCALSADHATVVAFDFHVGDPIPRDQWNADNLPTAK